MQMGFTEHIVWRIEFGKNVKDLHPNWKKDQIEKYVDEAERLLGIMVKEDCRKCAYME